MILGLRRMARRVLPPSALWRIGRILSYRRGDRTTQRALETYLARAAVEVVVYDPAADIVRFLENGREALGILKEGEIADLPWLGAVDPFVPPGGIVFDVGAFRGLTAQWFARKAARVYAFEPRPESVATIRKAVALRRIPNIVIIETAVSDREGEAELHLCEVQGHSSLGPVKTSRPVGRVAVRTTTLDAFAVREGIARIDFLKIDVEGFEQEVLRGAAGLLRRRAISAILFEVSEIPLRSLAKSAGPIHDLLAEHGYRVYDLDGNPVERAAVATARSRDFLARPETSDPAADRSLASPA